MYKALINIGDYKKGEEVPNEIAEVWDKMYAVSPVIECSGAEEEPKKVVEEKEKPSKRSSMLDDYLGRNKYVVVKNIKEDEINIGDLKKLSELEKSGKKRKDVLKAIKRRLEALK